MPGTKNQNRKAYKAEGEKSSSARWLMTATPEQKRMYQRAAKREKKPLNTWAREKLDLAAETEEQS